MTLKEADEIAAQALIDYGEKHPSVHILRWSGFKGDPLNIDAFGRVENTDAFGRVETGDEFDSREVYVRGLWVIDSTDGGAQVIRDKVLSVAHGMARWHVRGQEGIWPPEWVD